MYVCLFDIDGTLIDSGGAGESAMLEVLARDFDVFEIKGNIPIAGRTDAAITRDLFAHHDLAADQLPVFQQAYEQLLPNALSVKNGRVLPGVVTLLETLSKRDDVALGLLTGNYESAAWAKLVHFGLSHHFDFGAFGDVHPNRDDVARQAAKAVAASVGDVAADRIWVIGDTPSDIRCARAIDARVAAVATGVFDRTQLAPFDPDLLLDTLESGDALLAEFC